VKFIFYCNKNCENTKKIIEKNLIKKENLEIRDMDVNMFSMMKQMIPEQPVTSPICFIENEDGSQVYYEFESVGEGN